MSRNNVRGPTSALTEFLRENGITARTSWPRRGNAQQQAAQSSETAGNSQSQAGPSNAGAASDERADGGSPNKKKTGYDSDDLDASENDENADIPAAKKRKLGKAALAKLKAKAKADAKKKGVDVSEEEESEDDFNALSKGKAPPLPPVGSFEDCAQCQQQFTVTRYTVAAKPPPGFLCHECAKSSGQDPFKKPAAPRKRKAPADRRKITNFEEPERIKTLAKMCIEVIGKHIGDVEAFGDIGHINLENISRVLAKNRSLTAETSTLFYSVKNSKLVFFDATNLNAPAFCTLGSLNPNLEDLRLTLCGRMNDTALDHWSDHLAKLSRLELVGPFLVRPEAWIKFFQSKMGKLQGFLITQSPRFDISCAEALAVNCGASLTELRLSEIGKMSDEFLPHLAACKNITSLEITFPTSSLSDDAVIELLAVIGARLVHLDLSGNADLTDKFLEHGIACNARCLTSLSLADLPLLSDEGVANLFTSFSDNGPLEKISLSRNHLPSSSALVALLEHSGPALLELNINSWKDTSNDALMKIGSTARLLHKIDLGWCRAVNDFVIQALLENCKHLSEIKCYACNRLTENCPRKREVKMMGIEIS